VYHPDQAIEDAVALAKSSDVAVIIAGLNADWESEGYDRPNLSLPLRSDELIARVAEANPNTVVVIQAGSAVSMPWVDKVKGVVQAWYGGNETGNAIADIVYGNVNPSGRLPVTFPKREVDIAANLNYKSARTKIYYEEGIWVGYKHHNARGIEPLFPFGHGLSYTTFDYADLKISGPTGSTADEWKLKASVKVTNTGKVAGSHSVHFYTCPPEETSTSLTHPSHTLQAFAKVKDLAPGKSKTVDVTLDKCECGVGMRRRCRCRCRCPRLLVSVLLTFGSSRTCHTLLFPLSTCCCLYHLAVASVTSLPRHPATWPHHQPIPS
jgi:beta-glucosidase